MMKRIVRQGTALAAGLLLLAAFSSAALASPKNQMKVFFLNTGTQAQAQGKLLFVTNKAQTFYMIKVSRMTPGTYDVVLDGAVVDSLTVNGDGIGRLVHRLRVNPKHNDPPLPYDPRGGTLEIQTTGSAVLSAQVPSDPAQAQQKIAIHFDLTNMGAQLGATADATLTGRFGRMHFEVEIEGAAAGVYELHVDGLKVAEITVDSSGFGEVDFDSRPFSDDDGDDGLALLLTFDPRGRDIKVVQGATAQFEGSFPLQ